jgi:hypothetical protein
VSLVPDKRVEEALGRIARSDGLVAELHMKSERAEYRAKAIKDAVFTRLEGGVEERKAKAGISPEYETAMEEYFTALQAFETLKNEREREFLVVDVWRTCQANARKGNV